MIIKNIGNTTINEGVVTLTPGQIMNLPEIVANPLLNKYKGSIQMLIDGARNQGNMILGNTQHTGYVLNESTAIRG
jgi:hypothetical protein